MAGFNLIVLLGNLTRDPEMRYSASGTPVATFGLATNRRFKQGDELKEEVMFIDVVAFGKTAETNVRYLAKGSRVLIEGRLQQRRWETQDGTRHSKHEVVVNHVTYLSARSQAGAPEAPPSEEWHDGSSAAS